MPTDPLNNLVPQLRQALLRGDEVGWTDGQLVEEFVSRGEPAALEALVRRHGSMVWGVCRRVLSHHDAEDAFQATFLVLLRKAASIRPRAMLANWLYGVARQTALKARATAAKRRARERQVTEMPEPAEKGRDLWNDWQPLLDQELSHLPDQYRVVIVLCDLEGKTRKEAARELGVPEGTVGSRLARARSMLAKRLARHGQAVSGGTLSPPASVGVPTSLVLSTIKAVTLVAAGNGATAGVIPASVAALADGVVQAMVLNKLKKVTAMLLLLGMVSFASMMVAWGQTTRKDDPPREPAGQGLKGSYARFRLDVEIRGMLHTTEQGTTVTALWRSYQLSDRDKEDPGSSPEHAWKLDWSRAKGLQKTAKDLDGKEVIVTGLSELRQLVEPIGPGGGRGYSGPNPPPLPSPYWIVHDTITVTGLRVADGQ